MADSGSRRSDSAHHGPEERLMKAGRKLALRLSLLAIRVEAKLMTTPAAVE